LLFVNASGVMVRGRSVSSATRTGAGRSNANGVAVQTDAGGNNQPENRSFHLVVSC
jgi:hypothetical protein